MRTAIVRRLFRQWYKMDGFSSGRFTANLVHQRPHESQTPRSAAAAHWPETVKSSMLRVLSLAKYALVYNSGWAADSPSRRVRDKATINQQATETELLREELRIKDTRMAGIEPRRRPHYPPRERMAILEMKAARNWSLERTAKAFLVSPMTVSSWMKRIDEHGPNALVQLPRRSTSFPTSWRIACGG